MSMLLNEVLSITAQESLGDGVDVGEDIVSSMKS